MIKHFFTALLFLSCVLIAGSCKNKVAEDANAIRFEQMLRKAGLEKKDVRYLIWNSSSCGGCRIFSANLLRSNKQATENIKLIAPLAYAHEAADIDRQQLFIDSTEIFDELYFGVDNIGIVNVEHDKVVSIRNYNPNAMDSLKQDLLK